MTTAEKPIALPRKGAVKRNSATGSFVAGNVHSRSRHQARVVTGRSIHWTSKVTGVKSGSHQAMLEKIQAGLKFSAIEMLEEAFHASQKVLAEVLSIPTSTLSRRKQSGRLTMEESDRVVRLARLRDQALSLMEGDDEAAVRWLNTPLKILGNESPLEHARTELGARDVEDLITRLEHGVFS